MSTPTRRRWQRRIGIALVLIGLVPSLAYGAYVSIVTRQEAADRGLLPDEAARQALKDTWAVTKYLWVFIPVGMVVYLTGLLGEDPRTFNRPP